MTLTQREIEQAHAMGWDETSGQGAEPSLKDPGRPVRQAWRILVKLRDGGRRVHATDRFGLHLVAAHAAREPDGADDDCSEPILRVEWIEGPPFGLVLRNRLVAGAWWVVWALSRAVRLRSPFARAMAVPSVGRLGPWSAHAPRVFGSLHTDGATCRGWAETSAAGPLRLLARTTLRSQSTTTVAVSRHGWVARRGDAPEGEPQHA